MLVLLECVRDVFVVGDTLVTRTSEMFLWSVIR